MVVVVVGCGFGAGKGDVNGKCSEEAAWWQAGGGGGGGGCGGLWVGGREGGW